MGVTLIVAWGNTPTLAQLTTTNWTGLAADGLWTSSGNWDAGTPGSGFAATFNGDGNGNTTVSLGDAAQPITNIAFVLTPALLTPAAYTLGSNPNDAFNVDATGVISVATGVTTAQTIAAGVNAAGAMSVTNAGTGGLTLSGPMSLGGTMTVTNSNTGTGALTLSGPMSLGGAVTIVNSGASAVTNLNGDISGNFALTVSGTSKGTIQITGNNTYSGGATVSQGATSTLQIGSDTAFGSGTLTWNDSSGPPFTAFGGDRILANPVTFITGITFANAATAHNLTFTGPIAFNSVQGRTYTCNHYGQVVMFGSTSSPSAFTLSPTENATNHNIALQVNRDATHTAATLVLNDVIQDNPTPPTDAYTFSVTSANGTTGQGNLLITGANTYSGNTTITAPGSIPTAATDQLFAEIGVDSVMSGASIVSGPFGKGTLTIAGNSNGNTPPMLAPYGADRTIANPLVLQAGFFVVSPATAGSGVIVDPTGTTHSLSFTGPITDQSSKTITNNLPSTVALYLGSSTAPSTLTIGGNATFSSQNLASNYANTTIYDQIVGNGTDKMFLKLNQIVRIMNSNNTFSGTVNVIGAGTGATAVGTGCILAGTGTFTAGTINIGAATGGTQGGVLSPGVSGPGTLNVNSMVWSPYGQYSYEMNDGDNTAGSGINDLISGTGTLDLTQLSSTTPFDLHFVHVVSGSPSGQYTLATFAGGILTPSGSGTDVTSLFTMSGSPVLGAQVLVAPGPGGGASQSLVLLGCHAPRFDIDGDGDVDMDDFGAFQACYGLPATGDCACFDNGSGTIDADDLTAFMACGSGAGIPADPNCAP